ncbi:MAG: nitrate ABC transporter permease [Mycobacteriales bacterium]
MSTMTEALTRIRSNGAATDGASALSGALLRARAFGEAVALGLCGALLLGIAWQIIAMRAADVPTPVESLRALQSLLANPFYDNGPNDKGIGLQLRFSLQRVFTGFALAALVGVPAGFLIGSSKRAWQAFNPIVQLLRPVSPLAWFPIWLVAFQNGSRAAVFVIFITALWPTLLNSATGAHSVPRDQRNVARVFKFGRFAYLRHVLLPHSMSATVTGMRLSMGLAWVVIVAVEMLSSTPGVGSFVWIAYNAGDLPQVAAGILVIGLVGLVLDLAFLKLQKAVTIAEVHA